MASTARQLCPRLCPRVFKSVRTLGHTAHRGGVQKIWVFGSVARGEATANSDVGLLVAFETRTIPFVDGSAAIERTPHANDREKQRAAITAASAVNCGGGINHLSQPRGNAHLSTQ
jgi:hypothetical protein